MSKITKIKGFADLFPSESDVMRFMEDSARLVFSKYGYNEIRIPIVEKTELFSRSIGLETDVVQKEMYTFSDRKDRSLTLRPEATAGIIRAYLENKVYAQEQYSKYFTFGPMFRYERPQKGRMRQFHQINAECVGLAEPHVDAEMVLMLWDFLSAIGLSDLKLEINSLGCPNCRPAFNKALTGFLDGVDPDSLCQDCRRRKDSNPLRVLDCKVPDCARAVSQAPVISDHLCPECKEHFNTVRALIAAAGVEHVVSPRLVRGLDYYTRTTFEVVSGAIGAQSSVAGGGRYDGLAEQLGGPSIPSIGFACGMERLALLVQSRNAPAPDFFIAVIDPAGLDPAFSLAASLRQAGLCGQTSFSASSLKSRMRLANKCGARVCLILGGEELASNQIIVKNLGSGEQVRVGLGSIDSLVNAVKSI